MPMTDEEQKDMEIRRPLSVSDLRSPTCASALFIVE